MTDGLTSRELAIPEPQWLRAVRTWRHPAASRAPYVRLGPRRSRSLVGSRKSKFKLPPHARFPSCSCLNAVRSKRSRTASAPHLGGHHLSQPKEEVGKKRGRGAVKEQSFSNVVLKEPLYWASEWEGGRAHALVPQATNPLKKTKSWSQSKGAGDTDVHVAKYNSWSKEPKWQWLHIMSSKTLTRYGLQKMARSVASEFGCRELSPHSSFLSSINSQLFVIIIIYPTLDLCKDPALWRRL
ncbi:uncharacterized protein LOC132710223 [Pantherophis guttatus]|uniref:Uncharacterized protein LOC117655999 n=1 Tax=Pantherophis guttatus TaxID=94885 RepID=A0ABM3YU94_PANGU|nr:uncharacterized protein LOC117655999 [Pantherophis guttatus]XP_060541898.1 uncharacterized protein LOC132710223 [Pantherophis guttatus]